MSFEKVNIGGYANDGTGDDLREAFRKVNSNFDLLTTEAPIVTASNLSSPAGNEAGIFASKTLNVLNFKKLTSTDSSVTITHTDTTVNLKNNSSLVNDPDPRLSANLDLQQHRVLNGSIGDPVTPVNLTPQPVLINGISVPDLSALLTIVLQSNIIVNNGIGRFSVDFGSILEPVGWTGVTGNSGTPLEMGTFLVPTTIDLDFGNIV